MRIRGKAVTKSTNAYKPILRHQIEEAQLHTKSNMAAARYLEVSYVQYRKYAKLYGLFYSHMNEKGVGISKGFSHSKKGIPLSQIFKNQHPSYSLNRLKGRLVRGGFLEEKCDRCGLEEKRITDDKAPLLLTFKDQMRDFTKDNLILLCYNCMFLTTGSPVIVHRKKIVSTLEKVVEMGAENLPQRKESTNVSPETDTGYINLETVESDQYGIDSEELYNELTEE